MAEVWELISGFSEDVGMGIWYQWGGTVLGDRLVIMSKRTWQSRGWWGGGHGKCRRKNRLSGGRMHFGTGICEKSSVW